TKTGSFLSPVTCHLSPVTHHMPIKESSDDLSLSPVAVPEAHVSRRHAARDYLALAVASCGVGYIPVAPGTWGSLVGVLMYLGLSQAVGAAFGYDPERATYRSTLPAQMTFTTLLLLLIVGVSLAGTWAATRTEKVLRRKDPGVVVVDEVAGQLITFLFVPAGAGAWAVMTGFVAFRVFDIWKPYPIRRLEGLPSGLGVMADDVLAGAYAATLLSLLATAQLFLRA
ncbi:MAG TPA: phosphatidylglycerophosphatase A, partial [Pyrinomonadaceae bacterium]|nr:phosphatidylglycerophosphatase A [Pyrinomonadaceae bacterium]